MGLRRLRGRLDQLQGEANFTMQMAQDLLADLQDGFGVEITMDIPNAQALMDIFTGKGSTVRFKVKVDPRVDT